MILEFLVCFEGDEGNSGDSGASSNEGNSNDAGNFNNAGGFSGDSGSNDGGSPKTFSQEDFNKAMAEHKRGLQEKLKQTETKYTTLEQSYQELLANQNLTNEEREGLQNQLSDLQKQFRTKEQQMAFEKKQAEEAAREEIETLKKDKELWEHRFINSTVNTALQAAAVKGDAYNPQQVINLLRPQTKMVEQVDGKGKPTGELKPMVEMSVVSEETGDVEVLQMTPDEAVAHLKKSDSDVNLFKKAVRDGIGGSSATGGMPGDGKGVDHSKMTDEQYFAQREKDRTALGLKARESRWS